MGEARESNGLKKGPRGALALTGTGIAGSRVGRCPCLQMTRARTTSFWSRSWVPHPRGVGREGEVMETIPGAFLHLSRDAQRQWINPPVCW